MLGADTVLAVCMAYKKNTTKYPVLYAIFHTSPTMAVLHPYLSPHNNLIAWKTKFPLWIFSEGNHTLFVRQLDCQLSLACLFCNNFRFPPKISVETKMNSTKQTTSCNFILDFVWICFTLSIDIDQHGATFLFIWQFNQSRSSTTTKLTFLIWNNYWIHHHYTRS